MADYLKDSSANAHDALLVNAPTTGTTGVLNEAVTFDGVDDHSTITEHADFKPASITIVGWIKTTNTGTQTIFSNWLETGADWFGYEVTTASSLLSATIYTGNGTTVDIGYVNALGSTVLSDGEWHHVAFSFETASSVKVYVDGALEGSNATALTISYGTHDPVIGARDGDGTLAEYFNGSMDDLRVYNYAVSPQEIYSLFTSTEPTPPVEELIAHYTMDTDDTSGTTLSDVSGSASVHDATTVNDPVVGTGQLNQSLEFNAIDRYITVVDHIDFKPPTRMSVSCWIKTGSLENMGIVQSFSRFDDVYAGWQFMMLNGTPILIIGSNTGNVRATDYDYPTATTNISNNLYHLVTATYDGTNIKMYIDGVLEDTKAYANGLSYNSTYNYVRIGCKNTVGSNRNFLDGSLDNVKIYTKVLTAEEITTIYANESEVVASQAAGYNGTWDEGVFWDRALLPYDRRNLYSLFSTGAAAEGLDLEWRNFFIGINEVVWDVPLEDQHYYDFSIETRNLRGIYSAPCILLGRQVLVADEAPNKLGNITGVAIQSGITLTADSSSVNNTDVANVVWGLSDVNNRNDASFYTETATVPNPSIGSSYGISEISSNLYFEGDKYIWAKLVNTSGLSSDWNREDTNGQLFTPGDTSSSDGTNFIPISMRSERTVYSNYTFYDTDPSSYYNAGWVYVGPNGITNSADYLSCSVNITNGSVDAVEGILYIEFQEIDDFGNYSVMLLTGNSVTFTPGIKTKIFLENITIPKDSGTGDLILVSARMRLELQAGDVVMDSPVFNIGSTANAAASVTQIEQLLNPADTSTDLGQINDSENLLVGDTDSIQSNLATTDTTAGDGPFDDDLTNTGGYYQ